jgi:cell shape-determining protein MreD
MNWIPFLLICCSAFLAIFLEAKVVFVRNFIGVQPDLLPALMVFASLTLDLFPLTLFALIAGLCFDSLSMNPLGVSVLPLLALGVVHFHSRSLLLRENQFAQMVLGASASLTCPLLSLLTMYGLGKSPILGWATGWQLVVLTAFGAMATPILFRVFDFIGNLLNYQPVAESTFRPDRQIKRGRM